jgi:uncharacterized protein (TIGR03000 family)
VPPVSYGCGAIGTPIFGGFSGGMPIGPPKVITPGKDDKKITPGTDDKKITPGKDDKKITPGTDDKKITPGTDDKKITPGTDDKKITPGKDDKKITPDKDDKKITPDTADKKITPGTVTIELPARVLVSLPAAATLTFDGVPTRSQSTERSFVSPPLPVGMPFAYNVQATLSRDGQTLVLERHVQITGGQTVPVSFQFNPIVVVSK